MLKKIGLGFAVAALLGGVALAQTISVPYAATVNQNSDAISYAPKGVPSVGTFFLTPAQVAGVPGYVYNVPLTAFSLTFANTQSYLTLNPAGTLATGTITTAANPSDGQLMCIFSSQTQTALTLTAATGQSIANTVTALTALTQYCWQYDLVLATWERIK